MKINNADIETVLALEAPTTEADLAIVFQYGRLVKDFSDFVSDELQPAVDRLEAAKYPGSQIYTTLTMGNPADGDAGHVLDELETLRIANGVPGVSDWLYWRANAGQWQSLDAVREDCEDNQGVEEAEAVAAFDRRFAAAYPGLDRLISRASKQEADYLRFESHTKHPRLTEVDGKSYEDIEAEVREAVARLTGYAASVA